MTLDDVVVVDVDGKSLPNAKSYAATSHFPSNFISGLNIFEERLQRTKSSLSCMITNND